MIKSPLLCHASTQPQDAYQLTVTVTPLPEGAVQLCYHLTGDVAQLLLPERLPPRATDGLWQHTCFEAFVAVQGETRYHEFNFSPATQWAAYAFSDTRQRCPWLAEQAPPITLTQTAASVTIDTLIHAVNLPPNPTGKPLQLGLTAVLETLNGHLSYWALHHPALYPDFHDHAGFILTLNPP